MADDPEFEEPTAPRLYQTLSVVYYVWTAATVFAVLLDIGNGLDNFLHAPIGIKDNRPSLDHRSPWRRLSSFLLVSVTLRWNPSLDRFRVLVSVTASALLGRSQWHYEFIPGSVYLFDKVSKVFGYLVLIGFVAADGFFGWNCWLQSNAPTEYKVMPPLVAAPSTTYWPQCPNRRL